MGQAIITITVEASEDFVPVRSFLTVVANTLEILRDLERSSSESKRVAKWKVSGATMQSPLRFTISADVNRGEEVVRAYLAGLEKMEHESKAPPEYFNRNTLERAKQLVSVLNDGVSSLSFSTPHSKAVRPTQRVAAVVDQLLKSAYADWSTFEGKLETISVHGRTKFNIYEVLTERKIECFFPPEKLQDALASFNQRVAVSGKAKYTQTGEPLSIRVEEIKVLRGQKELPQAADLKGTNLTGGEDPTKYIRGMRDAK